MYVNVGPFARLYAVATVVRHPQYESITLSKDLALAILKEPIKFDSYTQKICLPPPQSQTQSYNKECYVTTLSDYFNPGKHYFRNVSVNPSPFVKPDYPTKMNFSIVGTLQKIKVQTFAYDDCEIKLRNTYLGKYFKLQDTFTCASTPSEADLCQVSENFLYYNTYAYP